MVTVLIAGGGTGGHVYPMLAVGRALAASRPDVSVFYVGTARGLEAKVMPEAGCDLELLDVAPLRGGGVKGAFAGAVKAAKSLAASAALVRRRKPDVVLSVGGYAGGPVALAARLMGVPLAVLEPNSVLGLTNKLLSPFSNRAYVAFGDVDKSFAPGVAQRFGVPLRGEFAPNVYLPKADRFRVLVLGGSLGAKGINTRAPAALAQVLTAFPHADVVHQTGRGHADGVRDAYRQLGLEGDARVRITEFISDVASELLAADVVVERCGASSLAELTVVGRASVLIPFPFAADQHQLANARALEKAGAAIAMPESEVTGDRLAAALLELAADPARRKTMADSARALGRPAAAKDVARDLLALAERKN